MPLTTYDRKAAVAYARQWALLRNPRYYNFDSHGGDCTNFVSQCLYAGSGVMNYKPTFGWYYINANNRSPSWTGVQYLYKFLTRKQGVGPVGREVPMGKVQPGDVSQFTDGSRYYHSQLIVSVGSSPALENILVCTHTYDSLDKPLSAWETKGIRFIHIGGVMR